MLSVHAALLLAAACGPDAPPVWPRRFTLVQRRVPDASASVSLATTVTFYDADRGANLIQITPDANASDVVWDLELDSRLSYYFTPSTGQCKEIAMPVGVLRPTWLSNATFLGRKRVNGRDCLAYTKADFIDYYADATTCEPVSWYFHTMRARFDSVFWAPGLAVPNASWLAPPGYCREEASPEPVAAASKKKLKLE